MKNIWFLTFIILLITFSTTFSAQISPNPKNPSHNCQITGNIWITLTNNYACWWYFEKAGTYKKFYNEIELKWYSCPKNFTWKFTEISPNPSVLITIPEEFRWSEIIAKTTYLPECQDCGNFTEVSKKDPNWEYSSCINWKFKFDRCKSGYTWNATQWKCILSLPDWCQTSKTCNWKNRCLILKTLTWYQAMDACNIIWRKLPDRYELALLFSTSCSKTDNILTYNPVNPEKHSYWSSTEYDNNYAYRLWLDGWLRHDRPKTSNIFNVICTTK